MSDGIATLSLEPLARQSKRASQPAMHEAITLREYFLGPENELLQQALGIRQSITGPLTIEPVPLFVYAPTGFGKSHLLQAIKATWARQHARRRRESPTELPRIDADRPELSRSENQRVMLTTGADLARAYSTAVKLDEVHRFQLRLQQVDLLLIDDLEELERKAGAQRQLATVLDHRQRYERPVILASQHSLRTLNVSPRLISRLAGGLIVPLKLPAAATRQRVIRLRSAELDLPLSDEACQRLASHPPATMTHLLQQLQVLQFRHEEHPPADGRIDAAHVDQLLDHRQTAAILPKQIVRATAQFYGLAIRNLTGTSRRKLDVMARSVAMYLMRELTPLSFQQVGNAFGRRDHTTVMHAYKKIESLRASDVPIRNAIREVTEQLRAATAETVVPPSRRKPMAANG